MALLSYWDVLLSFTVFGVFHSVCAHEFFKDFLAKITGKFFVDYCWRLLYSLISFFLFYGWFMPTLALHPNINLNWNPPLWSVISPPILVLGTLIAWIAFAQSDYLYFLGFKQLGYGIYYLLTGKEIKRPVFGTTQLEISGVYRFIRHPMMVGGLLIVLAASPSSMNFVHAFLFAIYMVIGAYFEERRLVRVFGDAYRNYQNKTGMFFPKLHLPHFLKAGGEC